MSPHLARAARSFASMHARPVLAVLTAGALATAGAFPAVVGAAADAEVAASNATTEAGEASALEARTLPVMPPERSAALRAELEGRADSCRVEWTEPYYYLWEWAQERCEATRCELSEAQNIPAVAVVLHNYGSLPAEKGLRIFLLENAGGMPGATLWSIETTTTLIPGGETRAVVFAVDPPLGPLGPGPIWLGHEEVSPGPPSSLFDNAADASHASSMSPCGSWTPQDLGDYLQYLPVVSPAGAPDPASPSGGVTELAGVVWRCFPQPARGGFRIELTLTEPRDLALTLHALDGRKVATLLDKAELGAGRHERSVAAGRLPSGHYWLSLETASGRSSRRVLLLK